MANYVMFFNEIGHAHLPLVGGKGANLGEMTRAGFPVPGGFCVTTHAYKDFIATSPEMNSLLAGLVTIEPAKLSQLRELGERIRAHLEQLPVPDQISDVIIQAWTKQGADAAYAIRSSATAEDLPNASFAGQQDTYLNIRGREEVLQHVRKCWASLFTDRAIAYRAKNGFDHRKVYISIVVQQMVNPDVSGIMFTADPVNGNRTVVSIDASFGLGEALVSGLVSADLYKVKDDTIISKKISQKKLAIYALPDGGTITRELSPEQQERQVLSDQQINDLAAFGKKIEQHYGKPQDIEFCMADGKFFFVQSRPITTLYPLPDIPQQPLRVLLSFGHVQMATDAMKPLGLSVLRTLFPAGIFKVAGGRIFVDLTDILHYKIARLIFPKLLTIADEAMSRAVDAIVKRPEFLAVHESAGNTTLASLRKMVVPVLRKAWTTLRTGNPKVARSQTENFIRQRIEQARQLLDREQGAERIAAVQLQLNTLLRDIVNNVIPYVIPGIIANALLKKILMRKFKDASELNRLNKSLPGNVTSEMGLELGDLADKLRDLPEVQEYLKTAGDQSFYSGLDQIPGGKSFKLAFVSFIDKYGMRCPGEIDLTNPRWHEAPTQLVSALISHIRSLQPGEHRKRFAEGEKAAEAAALNIMDAAEGSCFKRKIISRLITVFRNLGGMREHHKYLLVRIMGECKKAIIAEADELVKKGILVQAEDVYFLNLEELIHLLEGNLAGKTSDMIAERKEQYQWHQRLKPPRVMTSEGETVVIPARKDNLPEGTLIGSPVSAGVAEGIARVILRPENAILNKGEILVAPHTDPGWTPLFQSAVAIITEVGGLMTHGAVIAREYGIPAVVGVEDATSLIKDGQKIRVDGVQGYVLLVDDEKSAQ
ncbi:putative phosphoenolpyruvate synthase [Propionispora sp. 2/2-37]|uniref:phosphoenolpyruvate synthase n=1 Tax=Propionispora sp. 2/2-37 TaxID=1677858 RepID=UPI0006BB6BFB|nr:phosphoenolpyruvate synthase [Propionispora sp. 2/2-37]CUH96664.1 putative phosphoenolpyruvate synthase [Propionispora sp. 2/2-37]